MKNTRPRLRPLLRPARAFWKTVFALAVALLVLLVGTPLCRMWAAVQPERPGTRVATDPADSTLPGRVPWVTSRIQGSPDPPAPYQVRRLYSGLKFKDPVDLCVAPGVDRVFVAEQAGKILSFVPKSIGARPDLLVDLTRVHPDVTALYGLTFHPGFATNSYLYVCYVLKDGQPDGSRVSRFTVLPSNPPQLEPGSEKILITWLAGGHNGGCIKFGPDGTLFISTGDGAGPNPPDPLRTGQDVSDLLSSILRIDVDHAASDKAYSVPADNPFSGRTGARPEVWAYGLRNPWRMNFDSETGALWVADVGWELWEMVFRIEKGGNYGWSIVEGPQSIHPDWPRGPSPIQTPLHSHPHSEAASITGGSVYHGRNLSQLRGAYIYGDWVTGKIWALRTNTTQHPTVDELVDTPLQIVAFAEDANRELLILDYGGGIYELQPNLSPSSAAAFPRRLSETGLFASVPQHEFADGVRPFEVNAPMWSDHALVQRFAAFPGNTWVETGASNVWVFQTKGEWRFPANAVLGRTLSLETVRGRPETAVRVETQLLHYDGADWHAYSYRWNDEQTDAALVDSAGDERTIAVRDSEPSGAPYEQTWRFHSRAECMRCHNPWANVALAFTPPQLNRDVRLSQAGRNDESPVNQLRLLSAAQYFDHSLDQQTRVKFADPYDPRLPLQERARSWLQVNCSHCHREGAGGSVVSHFDYESSLPEMKAIGQSASQGTFGLDNAHVISPSDPYSSVLYYRASTSGQGHMPLIGAREVDARGVRLLHDWIAQLSSGPTNANRNLASVARELLSTLQEASSAAVGQSNNLGSRLDQLLAKPNGALALVSALDSAPHPLSTELLDQLANYPSYQVRDLSERFLPLSKRVKKLGQQIRPEQVLALPGEPLRGRALFFEEGVQCARCHRVQGQGTAFGPDLTLIGQKYTAPELLDQILNPSKRIEPAFTLYVVETEADQSYSGFIMARTAHELTLKLADAQEVRLPSASVKSVRPQELSAMPEGLLQAMTAQQAADLLSFLRTLR